MIFRKIELSDFRNIENLEMYPGEKVNIICGENAQGKTNLMEALWLFTGAKSFRQTKDKFSVDSIFTKRSYWVTVFKCNC